MNYISLRINQAPATLRYLGWYLVWLTIILCLYWPGIIILPKNDHPVFMLGRHLAVNDWDWFWSVLSYNRTRILLPGDYFAFRPLMIAIFALEDIFFRSQFVVQGIICCSIFSFTATVFFLLLRRLVGVLPAFSLTCLWIAQLAGSEIVLWQHINPYVLAPGFLCLAALGMEDEICSKKRNLVIAACILMACLTHEMSVLIACGMGILAFCLGRKNALSRRVMTLYLVSALAAVFINATDYFFIHHPPSLAGPNDSFSNIPFSLLFSNLFHVVGAIGMASFYPNPAQLNVRGDFYQDWFFWSESTFALWLGAISATTITAAAIFSIVRQSIRGGFNYLCFVALFFVLLLGGAFSVSVFRVLSRGIEYMAGATYYFSLTSLALCGLLGVQIAQLNSKLLVRAVSASILVLALWHAYDLRAQLLITAPEKRATAAGINDIRLTLLNDPSICFGGMDVFTTSIFDRYLSPLFQDVSCSARPTAMPLYVSKTPGLALTRLSSTLLQATPPISARRYSGREPGSIVPGIVINGLPYGHPVEFSVKCSAPFEIRFETKTAKAGFVLDHNLMLQTAGVNRQISNLISFNLLDDYVSFTVSYSNNLVQLRANNILVGATAFVMQITDEPVVMSITSHDSTMPVFMNGFKVSDFPMEDAVLLTLFNRP